MWQTGNWQRLCDLTCTTSTKSHAMKQDDDNPGLDWAALIKRAASHHTRWKLIQSENWKNTTTMSQDHSLLRILGRQTHFWQFGIPALYTQFSSLFALYFPLKVFHSYRENAERLNFLRSIGLWIIDVLLVKLCWPHKRGSLEKTCLPYAQLWPFPPSFTQDTVLCLWWC